MNVLNFTTYYEMKRRAGAVGQNGVGPLVDELAAQTGRIHLVGHSFGGRLVTAVATNSETDKIASMTLLQAAFSHNGFSKIMNGFFRSVLDKGRVKGPILITHTKNDKAVGIAYPLASRISGDSATALGDENDKFGGMGRNGAQRMEAEEVVIGELLAVGGQYTFGPGKIFNLKADNFIAGHSDVKGKEVGYLLANAIR
jgi:predicted alpha/beta hydrolase family esterase